MLDLDHVKKLSPGWLGAIVGAAAAGATIVPNHRILAAIGFGGVMLFVALKLTPCCAGCADGKGCGGGDNAPAPASSPTLPFAPEPDVGINVPRLFDDARTVSTAGSLCS